MTSTYGTENRFPVKVGQILSETIDGSRKLMTKQDQVIINRDKRNH